GRQRHAGPGSAGARSRPRGKLRLPLQAGAHRRRQRGQDLPRTALQNRGLRRAPGQHHRRGLHHEEPGDPGQAGEGNKSDLSDLREVQLEEAQSLAERYDNIICAIETSAKDSSNVEEAFVKMATELMMRHGGPMFSEKNTDSIKLDSKDVVEGWGCGC
uniref:RAB43, member RAS onco family n=1 Tax=Gallus gallus TaxID=9031 RepID=A0A8V1AB81_CHICK